MGTPGQSGGFDLQNFFKTPPPSSPSSYTTSSAPYPPSNHPFQQQANASHPYSLNNFAPNSFNPGSNFASVPGPYSYNSQQPQPGMQSQGIYHPYMHYPQDHGPRPPPYPPAPYSNASSYVPQGPQHGNFPQPQYPSSQSQSPSFSQPQSSSSLPLASIPFLSGPQSTSQTPASTSSVVPPASPPPVPEQVPSPPLDGAHLMALLTTQASAEASNREESAALLMGTPNLLDLPSGITVTDTSQGAGPEVSLPPPAIAPALPTAPPVNLAPTPSRLTRGKPARGRSLKGEQIVYDIDVRMPSEAQPQLEVSPITVVGSDPILVLGRQIAVNRRYICYGLRAGTIRILNINNGLRVLLRAHTQRVTDMVLFSEDVHLLASASTDGRVFVRKILEGPSDDSRMGIKEHILLAMQIVGDWDSAHPRVCWNPQNQDLLVVGIGKYVMTVDINKVGLKAPPSGFTPDDIIVCHVKNPLEGVHVVGEHNSDVTDLSLPLWIPTCFASASQDGTVRIWGDKKTPLAVFVPHQGLSVNSVAFISAPRRPDHAVLFTAGPLNRELKLWAQSPVEGLPSKPGGGNWQCIQTLEFKSSVAGSRFDKVFFNQVLVVPRASLILLANAKKNAIYVVHLGFGSTAAATRMDYLAEFSVTMPILSLTATSEGVSDGDGTVQVYCVQTLAIQQYALDLCQCFLPPEEAPIDISPTLDQGLIGSQVSSQLTTQGFVPAVSGYSMTVSESVSASRTAATVVTTDPNGGTPSPNPASTFGVPSERSYEQEIISTETAVVESKTAIPHQATENDVSEGMDPISSLNRHNDMSSAPRVVRPVSPARVPSFLKRQPEVETPPNSYEDSYILVPEQPENAPVQEQPLSESVLAEVGGLNSVSNTSHVGDHTFEKDGEVLRGAATSSSKTSTAQQQSCAGPVHLLSPSELMNLVARSKATEGDSGACTCLPTIATDPSKLEAVTEEMASCSEFDSLRTELNTVTESDIVKSEIIGEKDGGEDEKASMLDVKDKALVDTSLEYNNKDFNWESGSGANFIDPSPTDEVPQGDDGDAPDDRELLPHSSAEEVQEHIKEVGSKVGEAGSVNSGPTQSLAVTKGRKNKNKTNVGGVGISSVGLVPLSGMAQLAFPAVPPISEGENSNSMNMAPSDLGLTYQVASMQESLNQLIAMQKELQKQMTVMVAVPVAKEGRRLEGALGQRMERLLKAHLDALWARILEESAKREKLERDRVQQCTVLLSNSFAKDLPLALERVFKKELTSMGSIVARMVTPNVEKTTLAAVTDVFQKGLVEKVTPQLEKAVAAKLETAVTRQLQAQLQLSLRPALQEALRTSFEATVIPGFERSCQAMFEQVDATFQRGLADHTSTAQQHFEASHSGLVATLQDTVLSASSLTATLKGEISEGQRKLIALAENAGANAARASLTAVKQSNVGLPDKILSLQHVEESLDPTIELTRLMNDRKLEEAFNKALSLSDVAIVSWLCTQVELKAVFSVTPLPLSQGVLLSLVQQLGCELGRDTAHKLEWIREGALALNPKDPVLAPHMRPFLEQLYKNLHHHTQVMPPGSELTNSIRLVLHVVNSLLTACK